MALVIEDGSGLPNSNSFIDATYATNYAADRGLSFPSGSAQQTTALVLSGDWLCNEARLPYVGTRYLTSQRMPWPRDGASERGGRAIPSNTIPTRLKDAQAELAILVGMGSALQPDLENGGLMKSAAMIDVIRDEWFAPQGFQILTGIPGEDLRTVVVGYLSPILRPPGLRLIDGTLLQPTDVSPFIPGQYDNQPLMTP